MSDQVETDRVAAVFEQEGARLIRAVYAFARSREIAEDAVGEAFARAIRAGDGVGDVRAWVWRVAFRIAIDELAARRRHVGGTVEVPYEMSEPATEVFDALGLLTPKQRASIVLHHYAGYSTAEVAAMLASTAPAIRVHLSVGRRRLRSILEDSDD